MATLIDQQVDFNGSRLSSGVYFYRLMAENIPNPDDGSAIGNTTMIVKKMLLMK